MKKIIILLISIITVIATICIIGNIKDTIIFSGVLAEKNEEVEVRITRTFFDKVFNKMSENMVVEGNNINYSYIFNRKIFDMERYYTAPIRRMDKSGLAAQGYLYFDDKMENIVIQTEQEIIYSCEQDFFDMVTK